VAGCQPVRRAGVSRAANATNEKGSAMSNDYPIIRLEARGLGVAVTAALRQHVDVIKKQIDEEVKAAVETFDFEYEVRRVAQDVFSHAVKNSIENYFLYGSGKDTLDRLVSETLKERAKS
jgi:hypothetical protein